MTVQELIISIYEISGNHTQLCPYTDRNDPDTFSITSSGAVKILGWINNAVKILYSWKFGNGRTIRIPGSVAEHYFQATVLSGTAVTGSTNSITLPDTFGANSGQYSGWIIKITGGTSEGEEMLITQYTAGRVATVHKDWSTPPDSTSEFEMYHRSYRIVSSDSFYSDEHITLDPVSSLFAVTKIGIVGGNELDKGTQQDNYFAALSSYGTPTEYIHNGDKITFNVAPDDDIWFYMEYIMQPVPLTLAEDKPKLPENMHDAIILYCVWFFHVWDQDSGNAWARKRDLIDFMERLPYQCDVDDERTEFVMFS